METRDKYALKSRLKMAAQFRRPDSIDSIQPNIAKELFLLKILLTGGAYLKYSS